MLYQLFKILRINANLKQTEVATILNLSLSSIEKFESGRVDPKWSYIELLALKTNQNLLNIIKEHIKKLLKIEGYEYLDGYIKALELTHFAFLSPTISKNKIFDYIESLFSINEVFNITRLNKETIKKELANDINKLKEENRNDDFSFINWQQMAFLIEKHCL